MQAAQTCFSDEEMPNGLLPMNSNTGTIKPIKGPETYQGQGCDKNSFMSPVEKLAF